MSQTTRLPWQWIAIHDSTPDHKSDVTFRELDGDGIAKGNDHVIPFGVIHDFVAEMIRAEKISRLESAEPNEVFYL